jgi:hypothetical protein
MAAQTAAIGFSTHSGWAAMVALAAGGSSATLSVLSRARIELIDAHDRDAKQPYHAVEFVCVEEATGRLQGYLETATALAGAAISTQRAALQKRGFEVKSVGILDSAGRKGTSLASILASHALIHGAEGDHFRNALCAAADAQGLRVCRVQTRVLEEHAVKQLHQPLKRILDIVNGLGRQVGPPWGADQKKAALLAWTLLGKARG